MAPQCKAKKEFLTAAVGADAALQLAVLCAVELYVTDTGAAHFKQLATILKVGRCRLTLSNPCWNPPGIKRVETEI